MRSLISKEQLNPNISDLIGAYGSGYFLSLGASGLITTGMYPYISGVIANTPSVLSVNNIKSGNINISGNSGVAVTFNSGLSSYVISYTGSNLLSAALYQQVTSAYTGTINKGQAVYVVGANGSNLQVSLASNTGEDTSQVFGLLSQTLAYQATGTVLTQGLLSGIDTSASSSAGDIVFLGTGGNLVYGNNNEPYAPAQLVQIGYVVRKQQNNGSIFVNMVGSWEIDELQNVNIGQSYALNDGDTIRYSAASGVWFNRPIGTGIFATTGNLAATGQSLLQVISNSGVLKNVTIVNTGTNFTITSGHASSLIVYNSAANATGTVASGLPIGFNCSVLQKGAGQVFLTGASGATLNNKSNYFRTSVPYAVASIVNIDGTNYAVFGDVIS